MKKENFFYSGFRSMLPITTGVIPFGAVMGTVFAEAQWSAFEAFTMNTLMYAGAAQLASVDLMEKNAASIVVIITGLVINLRFVLYSAALSPVIQRSSFLIKLFCAYSLTDQNYAVMSANQDSFKTNQDAVQFYLGSVVCMLLAWHLSVIAGFTFGNFAPASWALDFAVPLSFLALVMPTIKNKTYLLVTVFSSIVSILLYPLPYKMGLIVTAGLAILFAIFLTHKKEIA
ncbi:MAG: AzlC family ABC transporter permease [Bdellovibrionaceae bacterium]|nr:AzlC family ABC transporter permease [Pseudobdellovibrionaceae bacterium]